MVQVELTRAAFRSLAKVPAYIVTRLRTWIAEVEMLGLAEVRKRPGFHDEPLKGRRFGQRSIRLNRSYRAIYVESTNGQIQIVTVIEVIKHGY